MDFPAVPFWDFSISLYSKPGVGAACLALQDRHEIDVNILMFCLWLADDGYPAATGAEMRAYRHAVEPWHQEAVRGLRAVRKWMKPARPPVDHDLAQSIRARLQKLEIDAEHLEQVTLYNCVYTKKRPLDDSTKLSNAVANIGIYFRELGIEPREDDKCSLAEILRHAFPTKDDAAIAAALGRAHV